MIKTDQGIMLVLICSILIICYFAPLSNIDTFVNVFNPQGSYISQSTFINNPPSSVENWRINKNLYEPGPEGSLSMYNVQNQFPYNKPTEEFFTNGKINLIKSDGVILGGYMPQILRPFDSVTANPTPGSDCKWPCYSDRKFQQWCSEENAINYHAMRPLISPNEWNRLLKKMFGIMKDKVGPYCKKTPESDKFTAVFCTESQNDIMVWLMQKVALAVSKMPEMQKNGPWKEERFVELDVSMYQYINPDSSIYFKVIFNLFNPLRSVATLVCATVFIVDGKPSLVDIDFVNEGSMDDYMKPQNGFGPITGYNISNFNKKNIESPDHIGFDVSPEGRQLWEDFYKKDPNQFDWNYMNTLEVQKFNKDGFYSNVPEENVSIEGGVPDSLKRLLRDRENTCNTDNLMSCMTPGYTGITGVSAKTLNGKFPEVSMETANLKRTEFAPLDGNVKNVYADPTIIFSSNKNGINGTNQNGAINLRQIETPSGLIYI